MPRKVEELPNGVAVYQVTDDTRPKDNIYCETPFCPPDSSCFVYRRRGAAGACDYVACDLRTWEQRVVARGSPLIAASPEGLLYAHQGGDTGPWRLLRLDLVAGTRDAFDIPSPRRPRSLPTVSPDERHVAYGVALGFGPQRFGIERVELATGAVEIIDEDPEIPNPHAQYEPTEGRLLMVQHNRGCAFSETGKCERLVGDPGATLYVLDTAAGRRIPLEVGRPCTDPCTGHETWIGDTGEIIFTTVTAKGELPATGNVYAVRPGGPARILAPGCLANHIGVTPCGRYFTGDRARPDQIVIGSTRTGRWAVVCPARASWTKEQASHPHAYLTPDRRWVVFNSNRTGRPEIHVASVPPELVASLEG